MSALKKSGPQQARLAFLFSGDTALVVFSLGIFDQFARSLAGSLTARNT